MQKSRSEREQVLSDRGDVYQNWHRHRRRFRHIFECPNSIWGERLFEEMLNPVVAGKRVLEIGCGTGLFAERLSSFGASYIYAVDISRTRIAQAKQLEVPGLREYATVDVSLPLTGVFDVIVGHAVLHHLDYQEVLPRLAHDNLGQNGLMLFYEPLGENWIIRAYHKFSKHAHTFDEHPFETRDLTWIRKTFPGFKLTPINFVSLPLAALLSFVMKQPDNVILRGADMIDRFLALHTRWLHPYFRCAIFEIRI